MKLFWECMAVALGSMCGGLLRFGVARVLNRPEFPIGTFVINITGSFFLGWFLTIATNRMSSVSETMKLGVAVGFVGAYTTFSTYMFESDKMMSTGEWMRATSYIVGSVIVGLLAVCGGILLAKWQ